MKEDQDSLFEPEVEAQELRRQVAVLKKLAKNAQAAANGLRELRHQQSRTIEEQKKRIVELERQVRKLSGNPDPS